MDMNAIIAIGNTLEEDDIEFIGKAYIPLLGRSHGGRGCKLWKGEKRYRHMMLGNKGNQAGDIIFIYRAPKTERWTKASIEGERFVPHSEYYEARILFRYYTKNYNWINYQARVLILDGPFKDKKVSIRF